MKRKILLTLLVILLVIVGVTVWSWWKLCACIIVSNETDSRVPTVPVPGIPQNSDWKTYTNDKYGFEFKYPSQMTLKESYDAENSRAYIDIGFDGGLDIQIAVPTFHVGDYDGTIEIPIENGVAYYGLNNIKGDQAPTAYLVSENQSILVADLNFSRGLNIRENFLKQLISTFRFTK